MLCPSCGGEPKPMRQEQKQAGIQKVMYHCPLCGLFFTTYERRDENEIGEHAVQRRKARKKVKPFSVSDLHILLRVREGMAENAGP